MSFSSLFPHHAPADLASKKKVEFRIPGARGLTWSILGQHLDAELLLSISDSRIRVSSGIHDAVPPMPRKLNPWQISFVYGIKRASVQQGHPSPSGNPSARNLSAI
ncbi:hypothetical protein M413DRAFT_438428 [Hebeloma cylindrosporum]|uniref:Uncharacterized protein n=1 Tax=Hebeloma cylindrosporum TaxID=76867 RepID=A0A0C2Z7Y9_HEBCY|nr:hypothetical protein M413DRAFT_438428 [Hebeloma cylindrosporum h7]